MLLRHAREINILVPALLQPFFLVFDEEEAEPLTVLDTTGSLFQIIYDVAPGRWPLDPHAFCWVRCVSLAPSLSAYKPNTGCAVSLSVVLGFKSAQKELL